MPIDTITPLRSNPSSFSFVTEPDDHAQLEAPSLGIEPMSQFVMAPHLGLQTVTHKTDGADTDSNSSASEDADSSSDEDSSDSGMDEETFATPSSITATATVDQTRTHSLVTSNANPHTDTTATINNDTASSVAVGAVTAVRPPTSVKRIRNIRNMFAAVKTLETTSSSSGTTVNTTAVQPLYSETVMPTMVTTSSVDVKPRTNVSTTTVTGKTNTPQLPRKSIAKRITSVSKHDSKRSVLSEESSSDSEGEESGEVTNSDSEDEAEDTKPKPTKQLKQEDASRAVPTAPEATNLQLVCSIPRQYMHSAHTPVSTPKSPVSKNEHP